VKESAAIPPHPQGASQQILSASVGRLNHRWWGFLAAKIYEEEQKWYGWSHRAICGFGIGDRIFEEKYGNDNTPFVKHGRKKIKTLADAKLAASRFASSVS
jgi:hypothetical protein